MVSGAEITIEDVRKCSHDLLWILDDDLMVLDVLRDMRIESILLLENSITFIKKVEKDIPIS